jgi:ribosomal protein S27E
VNNIIKDVYGNNAAVQCPSCDRVFVTSSFLNKSGRVCPGCEKISIRFKKNAVVVEHIK